MANAGTVTVDFAAETAKFTAELKKVNSQLKGMESSFKSVEKIAKGALSFFSAGLVINFAKGLATAAGELDRLNQKTGIAVETLSRLQFAAKQSDIEFSQLTTGITQFQNRLAKGDADDAIRRLGLELFKIRELDTETQLLEISKGLLTLDTQAEKVAASMELFGKAGADLLPFLLQGPDAIKELTAESDRLGATIDAKTVAALDRAEKAVNRLTSAFSGLATQALAGLSSLILGPEEATAQQEFNRLFEQRVDILEQLARVQALPDPFGLNERSIEVLTGRLEALTPRLQELQEARRQAILNSQAEAAQTQARALQDAQAASQITDLGSLSVGLSPEQQEQIELQEIERNQRLLDARLTFNEQLNQITAENGEVLLGQINDQAQQQFDAEQFWIQKRIDDKRAEVETLNRIQQDGYNAAYTLLTAYGGKYRKYAQILLAFDKAKAIANIIVETQISASKAMSTYGYPLGLAAAAGAIAFGAARIAAVASTVIGSSNSPAIGSPGNPAFTNSTNTSVQPDERATSDATRTTQVIFNGPVYNTDDFQRSIVDALKDVTDRDVIIFSGNSAQAQVIRAA
jgi:hypothetical protein